MMPSAWASSRERQTCWASRRTRAGARGPSWARICSRVRPTSSSITRNGRPSGSSPTSWMTTEWGLCKAAVASTSRRNRRLLVGELLSTASSFKATRRFIFGW